MSGSKINTDPEKVVIKGCYCWASRHHSKHKRHTIKMLLLQALISENQQLFWQTWEQRNTLLLFWKEAFTLKFIYFSRHEWYNYSTINYLKGSNYSQIHLQCIKIYFFKTWSVLKFARNVTNSVQIYKQDHNQKQLQHKTTKTCPHSVFISKLMQSYICSVMQNS